MKIINSFTLESSNLISGKLFTDKKPENIASDRDSGFFIVPGVKSDKPGNNQVIIDSRLLSK